MLKRMTAMLLCIAMMLTMVPVQAFAEELPWNEDPVPAETAVKLSLDEPGETSELTESTETEPPEESEEPMQTEIVETTEPVATDATEPAATEPAATEPQETEEAVPQETIIITDSTADAATALSSGTCGEALVWTLDEDGVLTISGTGDMTVYANASAVPWYNQRANILKIQVEEGVTALSAYAFYNCSVTNAIQLPDGLLSIGRDAFNGCSALETLVLPNSVESLGYRAFGNCTKLSSITLPGSWKECPSYNKNYSGYTYQGNLFYGCKALTSITLPDTLTAIPSYAFANASYLQQIQLPKGLTQLSSYEFCNCSALTKIEIPSGITEVPSYAFSGCKVLTAIQLPDGLLSIGQNAFNGCSALETLVLPNSVESIGYQAFSNCTKLSSITLPGSWKECPSYKKNYSGVSYQGNLFYGCKALTSIVIPEDVAGVPAYAFANANYLQLIQIPASADIIGDYAFYNCSALKEFAFPAGLKQIGRYAFYNCRTLTEVILPESVETIGDYAFSGCTGLEEIWLGSQTRFSNTSFYSIKTSGKLGTISWSMNINTQTLTLSGTGDMILEWDEQGNLVAPWRHLRCLTKVLILEDGITSIDAEAFRGFNRIASANIPDSVLGVGSNSFAGCTSLESVTLGESVQVLGEGAFSGCDKLSDVTIVAEKDVKIGNDALPDSEDLTVTYPETGTNIGEQLTEKVPSVTQNTWDNTLPGRDVVLVLDVSGSMSGQKINDLKTAVNLFLDRVGGVATNSRVAIVSYESSAKVVSGFSWNVDSLKAAVNNLSASGGTQYGNALNCAESVLVGSDEEIRAMVFFTDGAPGDTHQSILAKCEELWKNYRIYTVGFQPSTAGQQLLIDMCGGPENYYRSDDMDSLAEAFKSLASGVGSEIEEEDYYDLTEQRQFTIKTSTGGYPAEIGFRITVDGKVFTSGLEEGAKVFEETITAEIPKDYTGDVVISREGYVTYTMPAELVGNFNVVVMYPDNGGDPFVQQLLYMPDASKQSYKNCMERVSIMEAALTDAADITQRFFVDIHWNEHDAGEVWLQQGDAKLMLKDKEYCDIPFSRTFKAGAGDVYLHYKSLDGVSGHTKTKITVTPANNRLPVDLGESLTIPKEKISVMKILGESELEMDFSKWTDVPVSFTVKGDGTVSGTIGLKKDGKNLGKSVEAEEKTLREAFANLKQPEKMTTKEAKDMLKELTSKAEPRTGKFGVEGKVWLVGYFSGKLGGSGGLEIKEVNAYLIAEGGITYTVPFTVMAIPVYLQGQLKGAIKSGIVLHQQQNMLLPLPHAKVESNITISLGGGVGMEGILSGGAQGDGTVGLDFILMDADETEAYIKGAFSLVGSIIGIKGKWEIFRTPKYYFYKDGQFQWTKEKAAMANAVDFTITREPTHFSRFYSTGKTQQTGDMEYTLLKSDTTMFSEPQLVTFDDGTRLVVWRDVVSGRTGVDAYGAYYSYFNGSQWSAPCLVEDDGTNDYGLSMTEINGNAYVMWHDYDIAFGEELEDIDVAAEHINISVAKFNKASASMTAHTEFSAGGYDHQPQIRAAGSGIQLAWKCGIDETEEPEEMYMAESQNGTSWSDAYQASASWYSESGEQVPSDYVGEVLMHLGEVKNVSCNGIRAVVYRSEDDNGSKNIFAVYHTEDGWGKPIQLTHFTGGTYVDAFGAGMTEDGLELVMNITHANEKSDLVYHEISLGTDLDVVRADYDHFTLVPGKPAVFYARVTNRGPWSEDMLKLRLVDAQGNVLKTQLTEAVIGSGDTVRLEMNYVVPEDNSLQQVGILALPVHSTDIDTSNNEKTINIFYSDISVEEMRAFVSEEATTVTARIVNRGNVALPEGEYTLNYETSDGREVASGTIRRLEPGEVETLTLTLEVLKADELLYLQIAEYENENLSSNNQGIVNIQSVYQGTEGEVTISIDREYMAMEVGQTEKLTVDCDPDAALETLTWRVETIEGENVIRVDNSGNIKAQNVGSAYAVACVGSGESEVTARCRIDVTAPLKIDDVQLSTSKLTTELFSTNYAEFDAILLMEQNMPATASTFSLRGQPVRNGVAIESVRFTNPDADAVFELVPMDDRRILVVPKLDEIEDLGSVAKSYKSTVTVTVNGVDYPSMEEMTLTVKQSKPKLKAKIDSFNSFYEGQSKEIVVTGGTVTSIKAEELPNWLTLVGEELVLTEAAEKKNSGKVNLLVYTEEWSIPAEVTLSVKNTYKAPGLKLSASSVKLNPNTDSSRGVELKVLPKSGKDSLESLKVTGISAPKGYIIEEDYDVETGAFTLKAKEGFSSGKITLNAAISGTTETVPLILTVKETPVSLKLAAKTVTLNTYTGDSAAVGITSDPEDYILHINDGDLKLTRQEGRKTLVIPIPGELDITFSEGKLHIKTTETTVVNATYKLYVTAGGSKEVALTIKTVEKAPTVSLKAKGDMDLTFPGSEAAVTATFKNLSGGSIEEAKWSVAAKDGTDVTGSFNLKQSGNTFSVTCENDTIDEGTYVLTLRFPELGCDNTVNLKVKRTAVKLKLSSSKLTLNKAIDDSAEIGVNCTNKGYHVDQLIISVMDKKGNAIEKALIVTPTQDNSKLLVSLGTEAKYGETYKVQVQANKKAPPVTLTVTILKAEKSTVTNTLKVSGSLDIIRDGSSITVTPKYKNANRMPAPEDVTLVFYSSADKFADPVEGLFHYEPNGQGGYTVTKAEGAEIDHSLKYKVEMVTDFDTDTPPVRKQANLTVKMGSTKLTLTTNGRNLYRRDQHSRVAFTLTAADETLNAIDGDRIEIKDKKYQDLFQIYNYGNGEFAVSLVGNAAEALLGKSSTKDITLNLNVYMIGNQTAKVNTTAKLKLTIVK